MEQRRYPPDRSNAVAEIREDQRQQQSQNDVVQARTDARKEAAITAMTLTTLLKAEEHNQRGKTESILSLSGISLVIFLLLMFLGPQAPSLMAERQLYIVFTGVLTVAWGVVLAAICCPRKRPLPDTLSSLHDKKQLGPLIRTLEVQNRSLRHFAIENLIEILPTLHASDASLLRKANRTILLQKLAILPNDPCYRERTEPLSRAAYRREMDLRLTILKALEQVGGEQELATVERLAQGLSTTRRTLKVPVELCEAAKACLPYLEARADDQRASAQLLRAASLDATASDDLLRPAAFDASAPLEQLLRASEPHS